MITRTRFSLTAATVLMVLVFSAMWTVPAFADDSTPPPAETPVEVTPPVEEEAVEASPADVVLEEVVVEEPAAQEETVAELLAQVPEGTDLIVTDANGEALPLASAEAAEAIAFVDPIWCPTGVTPTAPFAGGCSDSYPSFANLISSGFVPTGNGVIWIQSGADATAPGTALTIDGAGNWAAANTFSLSLQGGWSGLGTTTVNTATPSIFDQSLSIINWNAAVSLADIVIDGAASNTVPDNSALLIETTGSIQLDRVTVKNSINAGAGATTGATLNNSTSGAASSVTVNNGVFENNEGDGLRIYSAGIVTVSNIAVNGNDQAGALIDNSSATTDLAVTLSGTQEYNNNGNGAGLTVISNGFVTITDVIANGNAGNGVDIDNHTSLTSQGVTVAGTNMFNANGNGLYVLSHGIITTYNIFAADNGADGVHLDNCDDAAGCNVSGAPSVYLYGNNYFYDNDEDGLDITTFGQIVTYNLTASYNGGHGARLDNQWFNNAVVQEESYGTITLYGYNVFNNNGLDGLNVTSSGDFTSDNLTANDNGDNGVSLTLDKTQPTTVSYAVRVKKGKKYTYVYYYYTIIDAKVTLNGANNFSNNGIDGLYVSTDGPITINNVNSYFNGDNGAELNATADGSAININGTNTFSGCGCGASGAGLLVNSAGAVNLNNISANDNLGNGVDIDNTASTTNQGVTLNGSNMFNGNATGLNILSHGIITTNNIFASGNAVDGVHLDNCDDLGGGCSVPEAPSVNVLGSNYFYYNGEDGLEISTFGDIITYNLTASFNLANGVLLDNQGFNDDVIPVESVGSITLYGYNVFIFNGEDGLNASSSYDVATYNLTANQNVDDGVSISVNKTQSSLKAYTYATKVKKGKKFVTVYATAYTTVTAGNVTLYGDNSFVLNNFGDGLSVSADGAISVYNLTANGNGQFSGLGIGNGAILDNCLSTDGFLTCNNTDVNPVTVYGYANVSDNNARGLQVYSLGAVNVGSIIASGNLGVGVRVDNRFNSSIDPAGVIISGTNIFNGNDSTGLVVLSYGAITLNNINAYDNGDSTPGSTSGTYLDNTVGATGIAPKNITLTGLNSFVGNYKWGLEFHSDGVVSLTRISANGNDYAAANGIVGGGVFGTANTITLTCGQMFGNGGAAGDLAPGYSLTATGALTINGLYSAGNRGTDVSAGSPVNIIMPCTLP